MEKEKRERYENAEGFDKRALRICAENSNRPSGCVLLVSPLAPGAVYTITEGRCAN